MDNTWKCSDCKVVKPKSEFQENKHAKKGVQSYCRPCHRLRRKANKYKISIKEYLSIKNQPCEICGEKKHDNMMCIDHCHSSGKVRGSLCSQCNSGIGMFKDSVELLILACEYLIEKTM